MVSDRHSLGNKVSGIDLENIQATSLASGVQILNNVVANSGSHGVLVHNSPYVTVQGNEIGTDKSSTIKLGNGGDGILLQDSSFAQIVNNVISNSSQYGVQTTEKSSTTPFSITISQNHVGTDQFGAQALPNQFGGLYVSAYDSAG